MTDLDLTLFDIIVIATVFLSVVLAFSKGLTAVALSLAAWGGAVAVAVVGFPYLKPYGRDFISPPELADILCASALFFITLIIFKILSDALSKAVQSGPAGMLDRSAGALFGLVRGLAIVALAYLGFSKFYPQEAVPGWVQEAKLKPIVAWSARVVENLAEGALEDLPTDEAEDFLTDFADEIARTQADEIPNGYSRVARQQFQTLIDETADNTERAPE